MNDELTYEKAGVSIDVAEAAKKEMAGYLQTEDPRVLNRLGPFASLFEADFPGIDKPVLVLKTEEPGSKQLLAMQNQRIGSIAYDLINHLVNDIIVMGAHPLAVLDTIICGRLQREVVVELVRSMAAACTAQGCTLVGGETSEQPGVIPEGRYILSASIVGVVDRERIIDGSQIVAGDIILGLASNGPHTNGYSLIRRLIEKHPDIVNRQVAGRSFIDAVLEPHFGYYSSLVDIFSAGELHGLAHITGGGLAGNIVRILPDTCDAVIDLKTLRVPEIFKVIRSVGEVPGDDMLRTFNMGIGVAMIADPSRECMLIDHLEANHVEAYPIGRIVEGARKVRFENRVAW